MEKKTKNDSASAQSEENRDLKGELGRVLDYYYTLMFSSSSSSDIPDFISSNQKALDIARTILEARQALLKANRGDFNYKITSRGFIAGTLKGIQANLNHLSWMARRVASGDLQQQVDFMGEFSESFNSMVEQISGTFSRLHEEEERWQLAMQCSRDGIWEINLNSGAPPYYSPRIFELLGMQRSEKFFDVKNWPKLFHPDDHAILTLYRRFLTWNDPPRAFEMDHKLLCGDGTYRWFSTRGMMLFDTAKSKPLRIVGLVTDIQDRKEREEHFSYRATHDVLTDLPNRILFDEHLKNGIALAKRGGAYIAVVMVDLDKFKIINDTLGHHAGDTVLVEVATRMQKNMRESDMVSRFGGDEFAMILAFGKNEWQAITKVLQRTMLALKKPIQLEGQEVSITASFGVSVYPEDGESPKILMMYADEAMYHAKALGRNACVFWKKAKRYTVVRFDSD